MECMRTLGGRPGLNFMIRKTMTTNLMRPHAAPMKAPHALSERFSKSQGEVSLLDLAASGKQTGDRQMAAYWGPQLKEVAGEGLRTQELRAQTTKPDLSSWTRSCLPQ